MPEDIRLRVSFLGWGTREIRAHASQVQPRLAEVSRHEIRIRRVTRRIRGSGLRGNIFDMYKLIVSIDDVLKKRVQGRLWRAIFERAVSSSI